MIYKIVITSVFLFAIIIGLKAQDLNEISISSNGIAIDEVSNTKDESADFAIADNNTISLPILNHQTIDSRLEDDKKVHGVVLLDPLSLVSFGPSIHAEVALGKNIGLSAGYRFISLGIMINAMYGDDVDFNGLFIGAVKIFVKPKNKIDGFFLSPHIEYGKYQRTSGNYELMVPAFEIGYRWIWNSRFSLEISDNIAAVLYRKQDENTEWEMEMLVPYSLSVKLGVAF